jgi:glyoxylase-like metal-dependent hydrolase (beta-lactamase superfamily II)
MSVPDYLHCLTLPTPFPVGPVNVYLAEPNGGSSPLTLVDAGPWSDAARSALEAGLAERGRRVEDLRRVIVTHHHADHSGLAAEIAARSGAAVLTHPYNFPWLADAAAERERHRPFYRAMWQQAGVPGDIVEQIESTTAGFARWHAPLKSAEPLVEGQTVTLGGDAWTIFHTPGHAGGLVCLWEPRSRTLLSNDHLIRDISSNPVLEPSPLSSGPRPKRLVEYLRHMQRMADLQPEVALSGHGEAVRDVAGLVRQRVAFHWRRARRILKALKDQPQTTWELTRPLFPRLQSGMDFFLGLSEVQAHIDLLEEEGSIRAEPDGAAIRWHCL